MEKNELFEGGKPPKACAVMVPRAIAGRIAVPAYHPADTRFIGRPDKPSVAGAFTLALTVCPAETAPAVVFGAAGRKNLLPQRVSGTYQ